MPLDAAEFIAELSITDPPGTDPLNQGDDQIRTTKRAVQQSFPNVGSAVPQTGAQMAQMAIKNEVNNFSANNIFSVTQTFNGNLTFELANVDRGLIWNKSTIRRWDLQAQFGGGSDNLRLRRYDAAGVLIDTAISVAASNGETTFSSRIRLKRQTNLDFAQLGFTDENDVNIWQVYLNTNDNNFQIDRRVGGVFQDTPVKILNATAQIIFNTGNITHQIAPGGTQLSHNWANTSAINRWGIIYSQSTGDLTIHPRSAAGSLESAILRLDGNGRLFMDRLPSGPTANAKEIYAKQSQLFAGTELVLGQTP